jgi:hypothetical protein
MGDKIMNLLHKLFLLLAMSFTMRSMDAMEQDLLLLQQQLTALAQALPLPPSTTAQDERKLAEESEEDITETPDIPSYLEGERSEESGSESEEEFEEAQEAPENLVEEKSEAEQLQDLLASESPETRPFFVAYSRLLQALDTIDKQLDAQPVSVTEIDQRLQEAEALISRFRRDNTNIPGWTNIIDEQLTQMLQDIRNKAKAKQDDLKNFKEDLSKLSNKLTEAESVLLASKVKQAAKGLWTSVTSWFGTTTEPQSETMAKARFLTGEAQRMLDNIKKAYQLNDESPQLAASIKRLRELQAELPPAPAAPPAHQAVALPTAQPVIAPPTATLVAQPAEQRSSSELKRQSTLPVAQPVEQKQ